MIWTQHSVKRTEMRQAADYQMSISCEFRGAAEVAMVIAQHSLKVCLEPQLFKKKKKNSCAIVSAVRLSHTHQCDICVSSVQNVAEKTSWRWFSEKTLLRSLGQLVVFPSFGGISVKKFTLVGPGSYIMSKKTKLSSYSEDRTCWKLRPIQSSAFRIKWPWTCLIGTLWNAERH